jgi:hypothetical protein
MDDKLLVCWMKPESWGELRTGHVHSLHCQIAEDTSKLSSFFFFIMVMDYLGDIISTTIVVI